MAGSKVLKEGYRYKAKLDKVLADKKVTSRESKGLIREARAGKLSQVEAHYLSGFAARRVVKRDAPELVAFVKDEMVALAKIATDDGLDVPKPQPAIAPGAKAEGVEYGPAKGALFVSGAHHDDPIQGDLGNCYLISALSSLAKVRPDLIEEAVDDLGNGQYSVTFYEQQPGKKRPTKVKVTVDATVPLQENGRPEYGSSRSGKELWPQIIEKAYASWKGSYDLTEGGMAATAFESLTGKKAEWFPVGPDLGATVIFERLKKLQGEGAAIVALSTAWQTNANGIPLDHAYSVLDVFEKGGKRFVTLRNPWGDQEPGQDGKRDGVFTIPFERFVWSMSTVEFTKP